MPNALYYGDNLDVLREYVEDESVDLIYLDPPFNSQASYNVLFGAPTGGASQAQADAFEDTWVWGDRASASYHELMASGTPLAGIIKALRSFLGESNMMAYLTMMAIRLVELHRTLAAQGTLYLHCDPTASHYLKLLLDAQFGAVRFQNEIVWQRTTPKGHAFTRFPSTHDVLLAYRKGEKFVWNTIYLPQREEYVRSHYNRIEEGTERRYRLDNCLNPNPNRPNLTYEWNGHVRVWRWTKKKMQALHDEGRIVYTKSGIPNYKRYLDEMKGRPATSVWTDIPPVNSQARERLGYPTQKPLALLERVLQASSNPGNVVLDPFCGCGTTVHAAEKLGRQWIGIDVTHYAITVIENRLKAEVPNAEFDVFGRPQDLDGARDLANRDRYQFEWWATWLVGAQSYRGGKKGADKGIDGFIYYMDGPRGTGSAIVSVKSGENLDVGMIRDLRGTMEREDANLGIFVTLNEPKRTMKTEAAAAGYVDTVHGKFPRVQIVTIEQLLSGVRPKMPPPFRFEQDEIRRPKTRAKKSDKQLSLLLPMPGKEPKLVHKEGRTDIYTDPRVVVETGVRAKGGRA